MKTLGRSSGASLFVIALGVLTGCPEKKDTPAADAGLVTTTTTVADAGTVDLSQCAGCQLTGQVAWTFQGIYRDPACTEPLVQTAPTACAAVPALAETTITFAEDVGTRKAGETATVTLAEQIAPNVPRYRKSGTKCVRADETAVNLTPMGCAGQKVCRDASGALACGTCRTLANGCPDHEESRMYAKYNDTGKPAAAAAAGGGNLARLKQCCNAIAAEAKRLGNAPEAGLLNGAAAQCTALVTAAGPNGNAPELNALKGLLAGRPVPAVCAGF